MPSPRPWQMIRYFHSTVHLGRSTYHAISGPPSQAGETLARFSACTPQKALRGGIPGDGFGIWGRFWRHFEGKNRQKMTNLSIIDF